MLFQCVPHDGKDDLERSIPRKLRGWREPGVRFVIVRDNDRGDCIALWEKFAETLFATLRQQPALSL